MRDFQMPGRSAVLATNGMVATSHPLAAQEALGILKSGGTAMDAAICGAMVLNICEPQMTGLAGDCFALIKPAGSEDVQAFNGSGRAPASANAAALRDAGHSTVPLQGPDAVTLPGAVDAFCTLSETYGRLGLDRLLQPAIHYAEAGVPVAPRVAHDWAVAADRLRGHGRQWYLKNNAALRRGDLFRAPGQAEVLRKIAATGRAGFYEGAVAEDILKCLSEMGGVHTANDLSQTVGARTQPINGHYRGTELFEHRPNGQGATAILLLNILSHFDLSAMDPFGTSRTHLEAEASKLAYDARNRLICDADISDATSRMCDPAFASDLAALIDPQKAQANTTQLTEAVHRDTVYITTVDRDGMAVSLIYSIFHSFGTGYATEKYGLLLHNRGAGFSLEPGHPNELGPGKRPMHTIIPGMLRRDGRVLAPFGVMGGQYQSCGHARFLSNLLDFGMEPQAAIDAPRAFALDGKLQLETGYSDDVRAELSEMGHDVVTPNGPIGGAQAIMMHDSGILEGASDPRKDGCALGY